MDSITSVNYQYVSGIASEGSCAVKAFINKI